MISLGINHAITPELFYFSFRNFFVPHAFRNPNSVMLKVISGN